MSPLRQTWLNTVAGHPIFSTRVRVRLLRWGGLDLGTVGVFPAATFVSGHDVKMHDRVFVNVGVLFDAGARIELESGVSVGPRVQFVTSTHDLGPPSWRGGCGETRVAPILVRQGTWIGAGAIILSGVTIGAGCVIAAGSVVTRDCAPNGLYAGTPAVRRRDLPGDPAESPRDPAARAEAC